MFGSLESLVRFQHLAPGLTLFHFAIKSLAVLVRKLESTIFIILVLEQ